MGSFLSLPILAVAAALQASLMPQIRLLGGSPDLTFLLVLSWSINADLDESVVWAFAGGIMQDLLSAAPTGLSVVGLLLTVFAVSGLGQQFYRIGFMMLVGLVLAGTLVQQIVTMLLLTVSGFTVDWATSLAYVTAPTIFYNLALIWPTYWFVRRLQRQISRDDRYGF